MSFVLFVILFLLLVVGGLVVMFMYKKKVLKTFNIKDNEAYTNTGYHL